eukprot:tig00020723_g13505.t1
MERPETEQRAGKRARVEDPAPTVDATAAASPQAVEQAAAAPSQTAAQPPMAPAQTLPDLVMSELFKKLGVQESWRLRRVCKRWKESIEKGTLWGDFELRLDGSTVGETCGAFSASFADGQLRLGKGASVTVRWRLPDDNDGTGGTTGSNYRGAVAAVWGLLRAITASHAGDAQPGSVTVEFCGSGLRLFNEEYADALLLGVLRALRPPGGAPSGLRGLHVGLTSAEGRGERPPSPDSPPRRLPFGGYPPSPGYAPTSPSYTPTSPSYVPYYNPYSPSYSPAPPPPPPPPPPHGPAAPPGDDPLRPGGELRAAFAPFGQLRSLTLFFSHRYSAVDPECAGVVAAACPLLDSVAIRPRPGSAREVLAALARLARLRRLAVITGELQLPLAGVAGPLAEGPAGRSLQCLSFLDEDSLFGEGEFPGRLAPPAGDAPALQSECFRRARPACVTACKDGLAALARMPNLKSVEPLEFEADQADPGTVAALGGLPGLRAAHVRVSDWAGGEEATEGLLHVLKQALSGLPDLATLKLDLRSTSARPVAVVSLLSAKAVRRALAGLELRLSRPLAEAEAEMVAALPALGRLRVAARLPFSLSVRPYEILLRGLRPAVAVEIRLRRSLAGPRETLDADPPGGPAGAPDPIEGLFAGRRNWSLTVAPAPGHDLDP